MVVSQNKTVETLFMYSWNVAFAAEFEASLKVNVSKCYSCTECFCFRYLMWKRFWELYTLKRYRSLLRPMTSLWISHQVRIQYSFISCIWILQVYFNLFLSLAFRAVKVIPFWILWILKVYTMHSYSVADGLLDFGTMRVFEENKLSLKMKNQGKYEIAYKWVWNNTVWLGVMP